MSDITGYITLALTLLIIMGIFAIFNRPDKKKLRIEARIKKRNSTTIIETVLEVGADRSYSLPELKKKYESSKKFFKDYTILEKKSIKKV